MVVGREMPGSRIHASKIKEPWKIEERELYHISHPAAVTVKTVTLLLITLLGKNNNTFQKHKFNTAYKMNNITCI